jgi:hypothetical protein
MDMGSILELMRAEPVTITGAAVAVGPTLASMTPKEQWLAGVWPFVRGWLPRR